MVGRLYTRILGGVKAEASDRYRNEQHFDCSQGGQRESLARRQRYSKEKSQPLASRNFSAAGYFIIPALAGLESGREDESGKIGIACP